MHPSTLRARMQHLGIARSTNGGAVRRLDRTKQQVVVDAAPATVSGIWTPRSFDELRQRLERQKARAARIASPDEVRIARLPRPVRARLGRIAWGTVSMGYQPELTRAWFQTMDTFEREAKLDEVFASSVFWVVTRTSDCFY